MKKPTQILLLCSLILIAGCAAHLATVSPPTTDLSGTWLLDRSASQTVLIAPAGRQGAGSRPEGSGMGGSGMGGGRPEGSDGPDQNSQASPNNRPRATPAMRSVEMSIEQNIDSMGVAYPDELYRDVDWGEKEFFRETVISGWQENTLVVITDSEQMTLTESYQLNPAKDILTLTLKVKDQRGTNEFVRVFNKK